MFEVDGEYANRKGTYKVLSIDDPVMMVRYADGTSAELKIGIQERIWENIVAEEELQDRRVSTKAKKESLPTSARHFVKVVNVLPGEELAFPGWEERVVMAPTEDVAKQIRKGDRLIYISQDALAFFAVATVTGEPFTANPKKYTFTIPESKATFFEIDIDADTRKIENGVAFDSVELENCPDFSSSPVAVETFCPISEDDFELLSEILAEISEETDEEDIDDEDDDFDEDEE
jgi:hypothetical protein